MPDPKGKMSPEEHEKAVNWLNEKGKRPGRCEGCGKKAIYLKRDLAQLLIPGWNQAYPLLVLMCTNCGLIRLHGAIRAGIEASDQEETANDEES